MDNHNKYWILFGILLIGLVWSIRNKQLNDIEGFENEEIGDTEAEKVKLSELLGLLLDNQNFANQIIIDYNLRSVRDLVDKNKKNIDLNLKPILRNDQFRIVTRYLLLNDIYFTGKSQDLNRIITFSRQEKFVKPSEIYKNTSEEDTELNIFRENYHLDKTMYLDYKWINDKINNFTNNYGLTMVTKSQENIKEIFDKNYWEGQKYLTNANLRDLPADTVLYMKETNQIYYKLNKVTDTWFITNIDKDKNITVLQRIIVDPIINWKFWTDLKNKSKDKNAILKPSNQLEAGKYLWIRSSSTFDLTRLYRKVDELSQNNYFSNNINPSYDKLIKLPEGLDTVYTQLERIKLFKKWIETITKDQNEQKMIIENIIIDLNHRVINIFDDVCCYLIFYQMEDFSELYLDTYIRLKTKIGDWWSVYNFESILTNATTLGQCYLPAVFTINQIQKTPPIFKFTYNRNLYHTFWDPLEIYISDMESFLSTKFKTKIVEKIAPIARFCLFNNPSLREYLAKYITCTTNKCDTDLTKMREPDRCGALKLKFQELMTKKMRFKCFYKSSNDSSSTTPTTSSTPYPTQTSQQTNEQLEQENKINQMFGFSNLLLLNLVEYAVKLHKCQVENITIQNCQELTDKIDTADQKNDLKLGTVVIDRQSDLFNVYDQQIDKYNEILKNQEIKQLDPLNILANTQEEALRKQNINNFNLLNKSADDFYSIINDLTNIGSSIYNNSNNKNEVEPFDNQLNDNMDLSDSTFKQYQARLERQIKGMTGEQSINYIVQVKNIFYQLVDILTKDGRMMTSGLIILIVSFGLYFIDISS
jgi:hypothetical protein